MVSKEGRLISVRFSAYWFYDYFLFHIAYRTQIAIKPIRPSAPSVESIPLTLAMTLTSGKNGIDPRPSTSTIIIRAAMLIPKSASPAAHPLTLLIISIILSPFNCVCSTPAKLFTKKKQKIAYGKSSWCVIL